MSTERKYLLWLAVLLGSAVLLVGTFNWFMDPHRFFHPPQVSGVNVYKTFTSHMRVRKPVHIYQRAPTTLILGSSRAGEGLHCEYLPGRFEDCYNAAIRGITPYEQMRMVEHAIATARHSGKKIERVILNLGFATFTETDLTNEGFEEALFARLPADPQESGYTLALHQAMLDKLLYALFSREALEASRNTLFFQDKVQGWFSIGILSLEPDGSWRTHPLPRAATDAAWVHGKNLKMWGSAYNSVDSAYARLQAQIRVPGRFDHNYHYFEKMLGLLYREQIPVDILLSPAHVQYMRVVDHYGLWPEEENWKRRLVAINERVASQHGAVPYRLWDFEGFNTYSTEPAWNEISIGQTMRWYKDVVHFSEELGAEMLAIILANRETGDWYRLLNSQQVEAHLAKLRADKDAYFAAHPPSADERKGAP